MDKISIFKLKIMNFIIQFLILSLLIYFFDYRFNIIFDNDISGERKIIIQFIANYILFEPNNITDLYFIYFSWTIVSLIPIFIFNDYKKAYSMNLTTFFFPNFFFYVFLYRYSPNYFNSYFQTLFFQTVILGIFIVFFSLSLSLILKKIRKPKEEALYENLKAIEQEINTKCPHCGIEFNSNPKYCYNCSNKLIIEEINE